MGCTYELGPLKETCLFRQLKKIRSPYTKTQVARATEARKYYEALLCPNWTDFSNILNLGGIRGCNLTKEDADISLAGNVADMSARHSDVGGLRQKRHVAATQDMKKETPTYPIYVNYSRQVLVSPNVRVSYPTIEFFCLSSKSNHVIADI